MANPLPGKSVVDVTERKLGLQRVETARPRDATGGLAAFQLSLSVARQRNLHADNALRSIDGFWWLAATAVSSTQPSVQRSRP